MIKTLNLSLKSLNILEVHNVLTMYPTISVLFPRSVLEQVFFYSSDAPTLVNNCHFSVEQALAFVGDSRRNFQNIRVGTYRNSLPRLKINIKSISQQQENIFIKTKQQ